MNLVRFRLIHRAKMTKATMFLLLQLTTVTSIRFTEYPCAEVCAPNSPDIVPTQSSIQCARRCLSSNTCSLFVYNREQQKCAINAEFCCQGWTAYYIGLYCYSSSLFVESFIACFPHHVNWTQNIFGVLSLYIYIYVISFALKENTRKCVKLKISIKCNSICGLKLLNCP